MKKPPITGKPAVKSPAARLRADIEAALSDGVGHEDMTLKLTLGDVSRLKCDADIAVSDISFAGGEMRFMGVRIEQGGVPASILSRP